MSGETESAPSAFTIDSLKVYFDVLREADKELTEKVRAADKEAIALALTAANTAVIKAETAQQLKNEAQNEWRATVTDLTAQFVDRRQYEALHNALESKLDDAIANVNDKRAALYASIDSRLRDVELNAKNLLTVEGFQNYVNRETDQKHTDNRQRLALFITVGLAMVGVIVNLSLNLLH